MPSSKFKIKYGAEILNGIDVVNSDITLDDGYSIDGLDPSAHLLDEGVSGHVPSGGVAGQFLKHDGTWGTPAYTQIDVTPVNGATTKGVSSDWAYDHQASVTAHGIPSGGTNGQVLTTNGSGVYSWTSKTVNTNYYPDGISFDTGTGVLTISMIGTADLTYDLDGRYSLTSHDHSGVYEPANANIQTHIGDATLHRVINDLTTTTTNLWSASKISSELSGKADISHNHDITSLTNAGTVVTYNVGTGAGNIPVLDAGGKLAMSTIPNIAMTDVFVVANQTEQLALTAQEGDVAIRTDLNKSYIHNGGVAGTMADWSELLTPTDSILSVNGQTGTVVLNTSHISEVTNLYFTNVRATTAVGGAKNDSGTGTSDLWSANKITTMLGGKADTSHALTSHSDVTITTPASAQVLRYSGSAWVNSKLAYADLDSIPSSFTPSSHASSATTYGVGTSTDYGHLKLSDSTSSTSGTSGGIAATPLAVKTAYDLAVTKSIVASHATNGSITLNGEQLVVYTHPTGAGNNHIPTGGSVGNLLLNSASGTAVWSTGNAISANYLKGTAGALANGNAGDVLKSNGDGTFYWGATADPTTVDYTYGFNISFQQTGIGTTATVVYSFSATTYRSAFFYISVKDVTNSRYETLTIHVVHDGTSVYYTEYGNVTSATAPGVTFIVSMNGSNVELKATGTSINNTVKGIVTLIDV